MENNKYNLTNREFDILKRMVKGMNNHEIADELYLSYHTIKIHVASILRKLNAKNRILASIKAIMEEII